ncbi:MAG: hypothetical protein MPJ78_16270 [Hyphomicrobiaceae bacterium]|nr:hypothetical protein [Hyphomicrobiaceae bacterium]
MVKWEGAAASARRRLVWQLMASTAMIVIAAGCTKTSKKNSPKKSVASINYNKQAERPPLKPNNPLHIATAHWARKHQKNPSDPKAAINYARNLKTIGAKDKAMEALARTYQLNPGHGALASEYGRLALDVGKTQMAEQLLNQAMRSKGNADWRVLSALGTLNAKRGDHKKAQHYYHAALRQQPGATSLYNNLALSYALDGRAGDAENLLKRAVAQGHNTPRVRQNLALVLGLQRKFDEAQKVAKTDLANDKVENNVAYMRSMVKKTQVAKATAKTRKTGKTVKTAANKKTAPVKTVSKSTKRTAQTPAASAKVATAKPKPKAAAKSPSSTPANGPSWTTKANTSATAEPKVSIAQAKAARVSTNFPATE